MWCVRFVRGWRSSSIPGASRLTAGSEPRDDPRPAAPAVVPPRVTPNGAGGGCAMDGAPLARVVLLGGFAVELAGAQPGSTLDGLPRGVQRLVAYLGLAGRPARAAVADRLWPDVSEERALGSLRSALWRLHKVA